MAASPSTVRLSSLADLPKLAADTLIDARSPAEFAEDHLPGAVNLPVLDDAERGRIGTIYVQESRFRARRIGAALLARNVARHLEGPLADRDGGWRPMVYCWRGGQRSGGFAAILAQIGWRVGVLDGGYRSWRRLVVRLLYEGPLPGPLIALDGNTGTAKTELLGLLAERGVQTVDLEALAGHRGSLFGGLPDAAQPGQKRFETGLAAALAAFDPGRPVVVEAESARIGALVLPPAFWSALRSAPRLQIVAPLAQRAAYLSRAYVDLTADPALLMGVIERLRPYHARDAIARWQALAAAGDFIGLAGELMAQHYDPRYARARARQTVPTRAFAAETLDPDGLQALADRIAASLSDTGWRALSPA